MLDPKVYPDRPERVTCTETHVSMVFLTGRYVYKVKKPVDFGFLDFSSPDKRRYFCNEEIRLNRRLSPSIYLGVVEIIETDGGITIGGEGEPVEYAVKMVQISEDRLMNRLLEKGLLGAGMIERVADRLAAFYATAETGPEISGYGRPERLRQDTDENFEQTEKYIGVSIENYQYNDIKKATERFYGLRHGLFQERLGRGMIRDCHGDLRLEHIYAGDEILVFDCIEFNKRFRFIDVASDLAFLAMDLDYNSRHDLADHLIDRYMERSGDHGLAGVLNFYKCYRAYVRGKVESFRLDDPLIPGPQKEEALQRALRYFELSHSYAEALF